VEVLTSMKGGVMSGAAHELQLVMPRYRQQHCSAEDLKYSEVRHGSCQCCSMCVYPCSMQVVATADQGDLA
jgi:3-polyprenyl-4-hydroxybenzoate decarboxylase